MEVEETSSFSSSNPKQSSLCEECSINPSKYRCPGCSIRSCSLACVNSHKTRTCCSGKRPRTQFVPLSQFDENLLISDYNLLEETKRIAESAKRKRDGSFGQFYFKLPFKLKSLKNAAARRKTHLLLLPNAIVEMVEYWKNSISWTIEWRFHSTDVVLIDNGVDENTNLCSVIETHLKVNPSKNKLRPFCEQLDSLRFFIRKNAKGTKSPFRELDIKAPISQQLVNTIIVEYPVIHVFLPSASFDFEIVEDLVPLPKKSETVNDNLPSPKGVLFKEEELEDDVSDPHIIDLVKYMNPELATESNSKQGVPIGLLLADEDLEEGEIPPF
ncbi:Box C/D snoRNA protein [Thalictrum thalictroides]|uniref:Box C/D snoRNA protein n=1 Tax=Thalictrum thalictroides TaxID=46969 RepID=A0A7J6VXG6_THATH|nr:Box C/D snoRNA protein [Thalictrum thalictroides]